MTTRKFNTKPTIPIKVIKIPQPHSFEVHGVISSASFAIRQNLRKDNQQRKV